MSNIDYVQEHRDKLMADPVKYIELLRKMNVQHQVWHLELQTELAKARKTIEAMAATMEGYADGEIASASKLHRYAQELRKAL